MSKFQLLTLRFYALALKLLYWQLAHQNNISSPDRTRDDLANQVTHVDEATETANEAVYVSPKPPYEVKYE